MERRMHSAALHTISTAPELELHFPIVAQSSPGLMFVCPRFSGALAILVEIKQ